MDLLKTGQNNVHRFEIPRVSLITQRHYFDFCFGLGDIKVCDFCNLTFLLSLQEARSIRNYVQTCRHPSNTGSTYVHLYVLPWKVKKAIHPGALCVFGFCSRFRFRFDTRETEELLWCPNTSDNKYSSNAWTRTAN